MIEIVGTGLAGLACAHTLLRAGVSVKLTGPPRTCRPLVGESLAPAAQRLLQDLDLADVLATIPSLRCTGHASSWTDETLQTRDGFEDPEGGAWLVDRRLLEDAILERALARGAQRRPERWDGRQRGNFLVDASGRRSVVARRRGVRRVFGSRLIGRASWGLSPLPKDHPGRSEAHFPGTEVVLPSEGPPTPGRDLRTLVEATPHGWWYGAPLPDERVVAVFCTSPDQSQIVRSHRRWEQGLAQTIHLSHRFQETQWTESTVVDASPSWLTSPIGSDFIAIGDAAQTFDPLLAQGMFHALYTGVRGAQALLTGGLQQYERRLLTIRRNNESHCAFLYAESRYRYNENVPPQLGRTTAPR